MAYRRSLEEVASIVFPREGDFIGVGQPGCWRPTVGWRCWEAPYQDDDRQDQLNKQISQAVKKMPRDAFDKAGIMCPFYYVRYHIISAYGEGQHAMYLRRKRYDQIYHIDRVILLRDSLRTYFLDDETRDRFSFRHFAPLRQGCGRVDTSQEIIAADTANTVYHNAISLISSMDKLLELSQSYIEADNLKWHAEDGFHEGFVESMARLWMVLAGKVIPKTSGPFNKMLDTITRLIRINDIGPKIVRCFAEECEKRPEWNRLDNYEQRIFSPSDRLFLLAEETIDTNMPREGLADRCREVAIDIVKKCLTEIGCEGDVRVMRHAISRIDEFLFDMNAGPRFGHRKLSRISIIRWLQELGC
ncbi:MAG TPA: hypothetical protein VEK14_03890 [Rhodomicrobium sp.]|nr:hypothetical protein [Rhodomicrobium sp.]